MEELMSKQNTNEQKQKLSDKVLTSIQDLKCATLKTDRRILQMSNCNNCYKVWLNKLLHVGVEHVEAN